MNKSYALQSKIQLTREWYTNSSFSHKAEVALELPPCTPEPHNQSREPDSLTFMKVLFSSKQLLQVHTAYFKGNTWNPTEVLLFSTASRSVWSLIHGIKSSIQHSNRKRNWDKPSFYAAHGEGKEVA